MAESDEAMNTRPDGVTAIDAAILVLFTAIIDPRGYTLLSVIPLVAYVAYRILEGLAEQKNQ
jgi:hypothetical protein